MSAGRSRLAALPAVVLALAGLAAATAVPLSLSRGRPVASSRAVRIVSLSPDVTEILFAMGLGDRLVGRTSASDYPPEAARVPVVGGYGKPSVEKILGAKPDLVTGSGLGLAAQVREIERAGIPVYIGSAKTLGDVADFFEELGRRAGSPEAGTDLATEFQAAFAAARARNAGLSEEERPKVYLEIAGNPIWAAGSGTFIDELIRAAGGRNALAGLGSGYIRPTAEDVIKLDPDVVLLTYMSPDKMAAEERFARRPGWGRVTAVRNGHVWADIDTNLLLRPGPRLVDGLGILSARLGAVRARGAKK